MIYFHAFYCSSPLDTCASSYCFDSGLGFLCLGLLAGSSPAASNFLLLRQKKVTKEKATRLSGSLRFASGNLRCPTKTGVGANSLHCVTLKQRAALIPFLRDITGSDRTGPSGNESQTAERPDSQKSKTSAISTINLIAGGAYVVDKNGTFYVKSLYPVSVSVSAPASAPARPVLAGPVMAMESRIRAARCLSEASLRGPRLSVDSAGCPQRSAGFQTAGRLSFAYFSLAKQRKVSSCRATPGQQVYAKPTKTRIRKWGIHPSRRASPGQQLSAIYDSNPLGTSVTSYCFDSRLGFLCLGLLAGGSPAASNFLLSRQKKVTKEKATRSLDPCASLRATCAGQGKPGSAQTRCAQTARGPDPAFLDQHRSSQDGACGFGFGNWCLCIKSAFNADQTFVTSYQINSMNS